ncbi:MAG: HAMP domain-containing sensor histidine kinase [Burkholderiaceae bacterium]
MASGLTRRLWAGAAITAALVLGASLAILQFVPKSWFEIDGGPPPRSQPGGPPAYGEPNAGPPPGPGPGPGHGADDGAEPPGPRAERPPGPGPRPPPFDPRSMQAQRRRNLVENLVIAALVTIGVTAFAHRMLRQTRTRLARVQGDLKRIVDGHHALRTVVDGDDEIAALAADVNRGAEHFGRLGEGLQGLLANASHELRSPLTRTRLALELLGDQYEGLDANPRFREVRRNIAEIEQLIDEILTASTLDSSPSIQIPEEPPNLDAICEQEAARVGARFDTGRTPGGARAPMRASVDPVLFRRLLRNLLENAEKYGDGQPIDVTLEIDGSDDLVLKVSDRGIGVPESERERIFEPFYRRRGASESRGGVGLGLALVRQIAALHGGRVWCDANAPHGSVFVCRLPRTGPGSA